MSAPVPPMFVDKYMSLDNDKRMRFDMQYQAEAKDPTIALVCAIFGVFHFFMGQIGLGIVYIITGGGCGIWWIIVLIGAKKAADQHNMNVAQRIMTSLT